MTVTVFDLVEIGLKTIGADGLMSPAVSNAAR